MKLILVLAGKIVALGTQKTRTNTLKSRCTQSESLFGADFGPETQLGHFSSIMSKERLLQSMAIVIGPYWTNFCSKKLKRRILTTFGFNRTALSITEPKLHSMFCTLFLKIALSATDLISFGHLGATIWHRWTKISVRPTSQRQLTFYRTIFVKRLVTYSCT